MKITGLIQMLIQMLMASRTDLKILVDSTIYDNVIRAIDPVEHNSLLKTLIDSTTVLGMDLGTLVPASMVYTEEGSYSNYTQTTAVTFDIPGTVRDWVGQVIYFTSDGVNTISFNGSKFDINTGLSGISDGGILPAGLWKFWLF